MPAEKQMFTQLLNRTLFLAYVDISSENYSVLYENYMMDTYSKNNSLLSSY